jgi:uncharacterized protein (DUF362 family)
VPLKNGSVLRTITIDRSVLEADVIINIPKLKTHQQLGFTGAIKNTFGCVNSKRKTLMHLRFSGRELEFGRMLLDVHYLVKPALNVVDGIIAMEGAGPRKGEPRKLGLIISSPDGLAVDRVIKAIINVPVNPYYLEAADIMGIAPAGLDMIEISGESLTSVMVRDFKFPVFYPVGFSPFKIARSVIKDILTRGGFIQE